MFKVVEALLRKKKSCPRVRLTRSGVLGVYSEIGLMSRQFEHHAEVPNPYILSRVIWHAE